MATSQIGETTIEMVPEKRPLMPADLFTAVMIGDREYFAKLFNEEPNDHVKVQIDGADRTLRQTDIKSNIQSATHSGNTSLHLAVTQGHNGIAFDIIQRDMSLLKARNKKSETPLHIAAKVGNYEFLSDLSGLLNSDAVKNAINQTNNDGDTALHVAAKHCNIGIVRQLMRLDPKLAHNVNNEGSTPLHIAIKNEYTELAQVMLYDDATLAGTEDSDGMFPVHVAARMGNTVLITDLVTNYASYVGLLDPHGRNFFHIAAEMDRSNMFSMMNSNQLEVKRMVNAADYEGNTPLHIAAMKGHKTTMIAIWRMKVHPNAEEVKNKKGLNAMDLCMRQLEDTAKAGDDVDTEAIMEYITKHGHKFSEEWFVEVIDQSIKYQWERTQVIGLGAVLITTVAFTAAFTVPGGYNQDNGTPIFAGRYMFYAFIIANALAFMAGFTSVIVLLYRAMTKLRRQSMSFASQAFLVAANSMVMAFGLGSYIILAPNNRTIAWLILVVALFLGSPGMAFFASAGENLATHLYRPLSLVRIVYIYFSFYVLPPLLIFCLAIQ